MIKEIEILEAVTNVADTAMSIWGKKKIESCEAIIKHTYSHLAQKNSSQPGFLTDHAALKTKADIYFCIYSELCSVKQYSSIPSDRWYCIADDTFNAIHNNHDLSYKDTFLNNSKMLAGILQTQFIRAKKKYIGDDIYTKAYNMAYKNCKKSNVENMVGDSTIDRFLITYNPRGNISWEIVLNEIFSSEKKNYHNVQKAIADKTIIQKEDSEDTYIQLIPDSSPTPDDEYETLYEKETSYSELRLCDVMRDLFLQDKKKAISRIQMNYFRCFYTDNLSSMQETSRLAYEHIIKNIKQYSSSGGVDIDFLNSFVEYNCQVITDAYRKPRKLMSVFKPGCASDERCKQPLELVVIKKFLGRSESSISEMRTKYYDLIKQKMTDK